MSSIGERDVHVWRADVSAHACKAPALYALLDRAEALRAARFRFVPDRTAYVVAHGLLRLLLGAYAGSDPKQLRFGAGTCGKPYLIAQRDLAFNLAHSGDRLLIAIARHDVGIDIERHSVDVDCDALAARVFSPAERAAYAALAPAARQAAFFTGWTRKEAYVKATGSGLFAELRDFDVSLGSEARLIADRSSRASGWTMFDLRTEPAYAAALVAGADCARVDTFLFSPGPARSDDASRG